MSIGVGSVSFYGPNKPGNGATPIRTGPPPALPKQPFGKDAGVNDYTGKHIPLHKEVLTENEVQSVRVRVPTVDPSDLVTSLADLDDTSGIEGAEDGNALVFDGSANAWVPGEGGGGSAEDPGAAVDTIGAGSEGSETASSDTWTAGGANGLAEWYVSRVVYNEAGDHTIYAFLRLRTYDANGMLYSVSGETRVTVDAAVGL